jgi:hypothetical protein
LSRGAIKQAVTKRAFERFGSVTHRRLIHFQPFGCFGETQFLSDCGQHWGGLNEFSDGVMSIHINDLNSCIYEFPFSG